MTDRILYFAARLAMTVLQAIPLSWAARLGRQGGEVVFWLDSRHRRVALKNLALCFQETKSPHEIRALARENFRRIGENYCCAIKTAAMTEPELRRVLQVSGADSTEGAATARGAESRVFASGHFGNFELFSRISLFLPKFRSLATYRGLRHRRLNQLLTSLREVAGTRMFERRTEARELKQAMDEGGALLLLFSDQSARDDGIELPFFGRPCFTTRAPAVMASRYDCQLFVPICYRTGLGRWVIEVGEPIPTRQDGVRRSTEDITRDVNRAFEVAIRRDPANWFWVHNRWKTRRPAPFAATRPAPSLLGK